MSMQQPDFSYNPQTGECEAPEGDNWGTPEWPVSGTIMTSPPCNGGVPQFRRTKSTQALKRPSAKATIDISAYSKQEGVLQVLQQLFQLFVTADGQLILVDQRLGLVLPADPTYLIALMQRWAHDQGTSVSESAIKIGVRILRERGPRSEMPLMIGRVGYHPEGLYQVRAHQGYWLYNKQSPLPQWRELPSIPSLWPNKSLFSSFPPGPVNGPEPLKDLLASLPLDEDDQLLLLTWMVLVMMPRQRQVLLELTGAPESGKSTLQSVLKELLDPSTETLIRSIPKKINDIRQMAKDHYLISLDNVTELSPSIQRSLSNLMQGMTIDWAQKTEFSTSLFTTCPVMLNGDASVLTDRELKRSTLTLNLSAQRTRYPDWINSPRCRDYLLPSSFNALALLLGEVNAKMDDVVIETDVSAAWRDFCRIGVIVAHWVYGDCSAFGKAFQSLQVIEWQEALDKDPVAIALRQYLKEEDKAHEALTVTDWLEALAPYYPTNKSHQKRWPDDAQALGACFGRAQNVLLQFGLRLVSLGKRGSRCIWELSEMEASEQRPPFAAHVRGMFTSNNEAFQDSII